MVALAELPRLDQKLRLQPARFDVHKKRSGVLVVSKATIDHNAEIPKGVPSPTEVTAVKAGAKMPHTRAFFDALRTKSENAGIRFRPTVGGNGLNIAHRLKEFGEKVTVFTWGNEPYRELLEKDLDHPRRGMRGHIQLTDGEMPEALVFPVEKNGITDRVILGTAPEIDSDFADAIDGTQEHVIINSLPGSKWRASLRRGIRKLIDTQTAYTYTPGSAQMEAVRDRKETESIYEAIANASALMVNIDELRDLIEGKRRGITAEKDITKLMEQALALGPKNIFVTLGDKGAVGASAEEAIITWVDVTKPQKLISTLGAGDAFAAGAFRGKNLLDRLRRGSASASFALENTGAHENPPTETQLKTRMREQPVEYHVFEYKPQKIEL